MRHSILFFTISLCFFLQNIHAQDYSKLAEFKNHKVKIYYSPGYEQRAESITERVDKAFDYYQQLLSATPDVTLLILSVEDWPKYTSMPVIGMPHYKDDKVLVVAAHDNDFWKSFMPPMDKLPASLADQVRTTYKNDKGELSMQPFFDLLALHELGHAFHFQEGINMQRKWMGELFVNIMLHTFVAEKEPASLPALTVFPQMVISGGIAGYKYTSLKDVHEKYEEIGSQHPQNYGWYQSRWHAAAGKIYDTEGVDAGKLVWSALNNQKQSLTDDELVPFFEQAGAKAVAELIKTWDNP